MNIRSNDFFSDKSIDILSFQNGLVDQGHDMPSLVYKREMTENPKISIMIPTYRRPRYLRETIQSAIDQKTDVPYEVVVIDNDQDPIMTTQVDSIVRDFRSQKLSLYRNKENIGASGNWNRCITYAEAPWMIILSDDDLLDPDMINFVYPQIKKNSNEFISVDVEYFGGKYKSSPLGKMRKKARKMYQKILMLFLIEKKNINCSDLLRGNPVTLSGGCAFNKNAAILIGGFHESQMPCIDYAFISKYTLLYGGQKFFAKKAYYRCEVNSMLDPDIRSEVLIKDAEIREAIIRRCGASVLIKYVVKKISFWQMKIQSFGCFDESFDVDATKKALAFRLFNYAFGLFSWLHWKIFCLFYIDNISSHIKLEYK